MNKMRINTWLRRRHHRDQRLALTLATSLALIACHSEPAWTLPSPSQDPLGRIAAEVMMAGPSRVCAEVRLRTGPALHLLGCMAKIKDTTVYYYQDIKGPIRVAGRVWAAWHGTAKATDEALQTQLRRTYGQSTNCMAQTPHVKAWVSAHHQWNTPSVVVQLLESPSENGHGPGTTFEIQYVTWAMSCDFLDALNVGTRPIYNGIEIRGDDRRPVDHR